MLMITHAIESNRKLADTWHKITPWLRQNDVAASRRRFDVMITLLLRHVSVGDMREKTVD